MKNGIYRRPYKVRRASVRGKEVSLPAGVAMKPGDTVIALYDGFVLYVPKGSVVDERLLLKAITLKK